MKNKKKFLLGVGLLVAVINCVIAFSYAVASYLMKIAIYREGEEKVKSAGRTKKLLTGFECAEEYMDVLDRAEEKLKKLKTEKVVIKSSDGESLVGHWHETENPKRVIIAMHGWRSTWERDFGMISDFWIDNGCSVLYVEQRGHSESGGKYLGFGLLERYDCMDWILWVIENKSKVLPIYLAGISMGAATVLMTAGFKMPENVHGIIADCGFTSPRDIWKHVSEKNLHLSYFMIGNMADSICKRKIKISSKDYSVIEAMSNNKIPILFIHGTDDHFVPVEMTYNNFKACNAPKRIFVVPGADHGMSYYMDTKGYEAEISSFWKKFDKIPVE